MPDGDADVLAAFEPLEAARALRYCCRRTVAVVNTRAAPPPSAGVSGPPYPEIGGMLAALRAKCAAVISLDATAIAESAGTARAANSAVLGALAAAGVLPFPAERLADAVRSLVPPAVVAANLAAFERARAEVIHAGRPA
ncbi:MAG: 2-oxoacid:acceptor oxidoreductase family protein [Myxococcota bacterium]|nr:2-oxoacid:acceptor oxidoreductase family protein [Myxococcota bacterium]